MTEEAPQEKPYLGMISVRDVLDCIDAVTSAHSSIAEEMPNPTQSPERYRAYRESFLLTRSVIRATILGMAMRKAKTGERS